MSNKNRPHYGGDPLIQEEIPGEGITRLRGTTVPTDASTGYAPGCIFIKTNGGVNTTMYVNAGTKASSDFNAVSV
jgi:hypothetical protein